MKNKDSSPDKRGQLLLLPYKIRPVLIKLIRVPPPLITQREFRLHWANQIAKNLDLDAIGELDVNWRDDVYWVFDGQHRLHALKAHGFDGDKDTWNCKVYENLSDQQMAQMFLLKNGNLTVARFSKFHIACTAGRPVESGVRRIVEANGLKISRAKDENAVSTVAALCQVYERDGDLVLGQVLRVIRDAYKGDSSSFDGQIIRGLGLLFNRFNGKTKAERLTDQLARVPNGARGLLQRAETQRLRTGNQKPQCVAAAAVDAYNKGIKGRDRLPSWWKSNEGA